VSQHAAERGLDDLANGRDVGTNTDEWLGVLPTHDTNTALGRDTLDTLLSGVGDAIDPVGGEFPCRYTTVVLTATRT
jgi:hypothetical protein